MVNLTKSTKPTTEDDIKRDWHLIDLKGKVLGRSIAEIVRLLTGKNKTNYVTYLDMGDYIVVINARQLIVTGKKSKTVTYSRYSGYPGGLKTISFEQQMVKDPAKIVIHAVAGMLPKNKLRKKRLTRLYVFADEKHTYKEKFEVRNTKSQMNSKP